MPTEPTDIIQDNHSTRIAFKRRVRITTITSTDGDSIDNHMPQSTMDDSNDDKLRRHSEISLSAHLTIIQMLEFST